jgi:hypothetical protein
MLTGGKQGDVAASDCRKHAVPPRIGTGATDGAGAMEKPTLPLPK